MTRKENVEESKGTGREEAAKESPDEDTKIDVQVDSADEAPEASRPDGTADIDPGRRIDELEDKLLRSAAEFENYKKRTLRQLDQIRETAADGVLIHLLEIADNFDRAMAHADGNSDADSLRQGMELIQAQIGDLLKKYGAEPIESVGMQFDPSLHEAMMQVESDEHPAGEVALEISRGYKRGDRVLRFAKVGVSKGAPGAVDEEAAPENIE